MTAPKPADKPDCPLCAAAHQAGPAARLHGEFDATCLGCCSRDLARSAAAWRALNGITDVDLRNAIAALWGDRYAEGRRAVWAWIQSLGINCKAPE